MNTHVSKCKNDLKKKTKILFMFNDETLNYLSLSLNLGTKPSYSLSYDQQHMRFKSAQ
jgi:hypothetical protein